jgi:hypothetical protein
VAVSLELHPEKLKQAVTVDVLLYRCAMQMLTVL